VTPLSLDCLTLTATPPAEQVRAAAAAGFDRVSLWVQPPAAFEAALVTSANAGAVAGALADTGVVAHTIEVFDLASEAALEGYRPALELGARLGGKAVLAINYQNPDKAHVASLLARLAELAGQVGLGVNLEPVAMAHTATPAQARDLIRAAGVDAGIVLDTWHFVRAGGVAADLLALDPGLIRYVQVNDGPLASDRAGWPLEAMSERALPGQGEFPLDAIVACLPRDIPWAVESPSLARAARMTTAGQAVAAMAALRTLLAHG